MAITEKPGVGVEEEVGKEKKDTFLGIREASSVSQLSFSKQSNCRNSTPYRASLVAQMVKNSPANEETQDPSLGPEDPLEEGMATHSSYLAWKIPWTEETGGLQYTGVAKRHE